MDVFAVLADPTRRQIIESLSVGERSFGTIADQFEMSRPAVSQHLKVLRDANMVSVRAEAQKRIYSLQPHSFQEVDNWLARIRRFWPERLDRLEQAIREQEEK